MPQDKGIGRPQQPPIEQLKSGTNYLFAIGINTYENFTPLLNARKDIEDLAHVLGEHYYFDAQNIRLLCDADATRDNIIDELDGLRSKVKADDRLLIYYSGHGFLNGERGFWIPVNAKRDRVSSYIANAEVRDIIQSIKARHVLLISDSCFSASLLVRDATRDINGAFANWERHPSRWVFISGKGVVSDGKVGENSPFAKGILKHLRENEVEALNIVSLADLVTKQIRFNYEQQADISPLYQAGHEGGQFVFFKRQTEKDDWHVALKQNTEGSYLAYLNKYSNGQFEKEAEQKLVEIADEKEWQNATMRDAAFAYRQYLRKYQHGNHAAEAKEKLALIEDNERREREAEKLERDRLAKLESDRKEVERLAKLESDKKEAERIAKLELDRKEAERLTKLESDKKEAERLAKLESDKKEAQRLAKIESDRKEAERIAKIEADKRETPSLFQKYRMPIAGISVVIASLLIWQSLKSSEPNPSIIPSGISESTKPNLPIENTSTQPQNNTANNTSQGSVSIDPNKLPPNVTVGKPVDKPKTKLTKPTTDVNAEAIAQAENNKKLEEARRIAQLMNQQDEQIKADKTAALRYLQTAFANIGAEDFEAAKTTLSNAKNIKTLSSATKKAIQTALAYTGAEDKDNSKKAIEEAKKIINAN